MFLICGEEKKNKSGNKILKECEHGMVLGLVTIYQQIIPTDITYSVLVLRDVG